MQSIKNIMHFAEIGIDHIACKPAEAVTPADVAVMGELADMLKDAIAAKLDYMELRHEHGYDMATGAHKHSSPTSHNGEHSHVWEEEDEWGNAHPEAQRLFAELKEHYDGYWKYLAMHQKTGCSMSKAKMLEHFKRQLMAHDAIAEFVKGNCPAACPEIRAILVEWLNKKAA